MSEKKERKSKSKTTPQLLTGGSVRILPFGGSLGNNDILSDHRQTTSPLKGFLKDVVDFNRFEKIYFTEDLPQKDSTLLISSDIERLEESIVNAKENSLIITIGSHKIVDVARVLKRSLPSEILNQFKQILFHQ